MHITDLMPLISALFVFFLSLMVWLKNRQSRINKTFFHHSLAIVIWLFGTFMMFLSRADEAEVIFWDRFVYIGVVFIPVLVYHFGLAYTRKKNDAFLYLGYVLSVFFLFISRTEYFVNGIFSYKWGIHTKAQIFHHIFLVYFVFYVIVWFFKTFRYYQQLRSPIMRQQTKYVFFGFLLLFAIGPLAYLPAYGIGIYPFSYVSGLLFTIIMSYAIIRHRLMDIKLALRGSSVFVSSLATVLLSAVVIKYSALIYFPGLYWVDLLIFIFGVSLFPRIKGHYYKLANKYFFSSLYDGQEVIARLGDGLRSTLELKMIYDHIHKILDSAFHMRSFAVLKRSRDGKYRIKFSQGFKNEKLVVFPDDDDFKRIFSRESGVIIIEEIRGLLKSGVNKHTADTLHELKTAVIVPLNIKNKNAGWLLVGPKESGDIYNQEDIKVLGIISVQAAMAIENAFLYEEILNFNKKLKIEVEKATASLRRANAKLKQLDEAKSEFVSIASHQLRTPLTIIKGYISIMLEGGFGSFSEGARDSLEKVYESNERLIRLVENLLNISRIESGRLKFNFEASNLTELLSGVVEELESVADKKNIELVFKVQKKNLPLVNIDREKIRQVAMNLVDNAIKYSQKGKITISVKLDKENMLVSVADHGMGMSKDDQLSLFEKFSRGTDVSLVHTDGTGLGLYVAKQMIKAHGGRIWAESSGLGRGSKFYFSLPVLKV